MKFFVIKNIFMLQNNSTFMNSKNLWNRNNQVILVAKKTYLLKL